MPNPIPPQLNARALYCISVVIDIEGGYSPGAPSDPGGETKYGISKREYPNLDIKSLTFDDATRILFKDYWLACRCQSLPQPLDLYVLDAATNQGQPTAARLLQKVCGVAVDGKIGDKTVAAVRPEFGNEYLVQRALKYAGTANFDVNGHSWLSRLFRITSR